MYSLKNKIIFITGASSGIGEACAEQFAALGANIILTARRVERLSALAGTLKSKYQVKVLPIELDVTNKNSVITCIQSLTAEWRDIDVLVNNAGLALDSLPLQNGKIENWEVMIDTNIKGLLYVTHAVIQNMIKRNSGHIVNISSIAGHDYYPTGNIYSATKHAVRAVSKSLRMDLLGKEIRVSDIAPGAVETEFSIVRWKDQHKADQFYADFSPLVAEDIADAVVYCTTRSLHVDVSEIVIMPTAQASVNHLAKRGKTSKSIFE